MSKAEDRAALIARARDIGERIKALREAHPDEVHHDVLFKMAALLGEIEATLASTSDEAAE